MQMAQVKATVQISFGKKARRAMATSSLPGTKQQAAVSKCVK